MNPENEHEKSVTPSRIPVAKRTNSLKSTQPIIKSRAEKQNLEFKNALPRKTPSFKSDSNSNQKRNKISASKSILISPTKSQIPTFNSNATSTPKSPTNEPPNGNSKIPVSINRVSSFKTAKLSKNFESSKSPEQIEFEINAEPTKQKPLNPEPMNFESSDSDSENQNEESINSVSSNDENHNHSGIVNFRTNGAKRIVPETFDSEPVENPLVDPAHFVINSVDLEPVNAKLIDPEPVYPEPVNPEPVNTEMFESVESISIESDIPESYVPKPTPTPRKSIIKLSNSNLFDLSTREFTQSTDSNKFESNEGQVDINQNQQQTVEPIAADEPIKQNDPILIENVPVSEVENNSLNDENKAKIRIPAKRHSLKGGLSLRIPENSEKDSFQSEQLIKTPAPLNVSTLMGGLLSKVNESETFETQIVEEVKANEIVEPTKPEIEVQKHEGLPDFQVEQDKPENSQNFENKIEQTSDDVAIEESFKPNFKSKFEESVSKTTENSPGIIRYVPITMESDTAESKTDYANQNDSHPQKSPLPSPTKPKHFTSPNSKSVSNLYTSHPKTPTSASLIFPSWSIMNLNSPKSATSINSLHSSPSHGNILVEEIDAKSPNKSIIKTTSYSTSGPGLLSAVSQDAFTFNFDEKSAFSKEFLETHFPEFSQSSNQNVNSPLKSNQSSERAQFFEQNSIPGQTQENQKEPEQIQNESKLQEPQKSFQSTPKIKPKLVIEIPNSNQPKNQPETQLRVPKFPNSKTDRVEPQNKINKNDLESGEISHQATNRPQSSHSVGSFTSGTTKTTNKKSLWHKTVSKTTYRNFWKRVKSIL